MGPKRYNRAKAEAYECGIQPTPRAEGGGRVPIKYFLTAMLFIIFDIESVFLYPFAVAFNQLGLFALVEMILFIAVSYTHLDVYKRQVARCMTLGRCRTNGDSGTFIDEQCGARAVSYTHLIAAAPQRTASKAARVSMPASSASNRATWVGTSDT